MSITGYRLRSTDLVPPGLFDEKKGASGSKIEFKLIRNDETSQSLVFLLMVRNIYSFELKMMNESYITRLVFNPHHYNIIVMVDGVVIGGVCFRLFTDQQFAEIAFFAISSKNNVSGVGKRLMTKLKCYLQSFCITGVFVYADNSAVNFFRSQGFGNDTNLEYDTWKQYIKSYVGSSLMYCYINPSIDYRRLDSLIKDQLKKIEEIMPTVDIVTSIPKGIIISQSLDTNLQIAYIIECLKLHSKAWPFLEPIPRDTANDYYEVIINPMDISTIEKKLDQKKYHNFNEFYTDLGLIFENCFRYNESSSIYCKCAVELKKYSEKLIKKLRIMI